MADRTCPNGHVSDWDDYCSQCGAQIEPSTVDATRSVADAPAPPPLGESNGGTCASCGARYLVTDLFCEACGADLAVASDQSSVTAAEAPSLPPANGGHIELTVDQEYFDRFVEAGQLMFPDPVPSPSMLPITKDELLVGRRSESRGVYPDIDAEQITGDPAVSHRHLLLTRGPDGAWSVTDQGSTNGSRLGDALETLAPGRVYPLAIDDVVHVGAWTAIRLR